MILLFCAYGAILISYDHLTNVIILDYMCKLYLCVNDDKPNAEENV